ncbi:SDR family NAD(P)-dependent oxidoreductase, partial [bacterium]|nr:SDR family NAD(P)-dependent oxidoreductase [candidate division CSSED10-310 bacterium]
MLQNKTIILTGAGRGIGQVSAVNLAKEGATIALLSRTVEELEETAELIRQYDSNSLIIPVDISDPEQLEIAFQRIKNRFYQIDILINNAGIQPPIGRFHENNTREWIRNIRINLLGTIHLTHLVLPEMIDRRKGKIINM